MPLMHLNLNLCTPSSPSESPKCREDEMAKLSFGFPWKTESRTSSQRSQRKKKDFDREKILEQTPRFLNNSDDSNDGVSTSMCPESHSEAEMSLKTRVSINKNNESYLSTPKSVLKFGVERLLSTNQSECALSRTEYENSSRKSINSMLPFSSLLHTLPPVTSADLRHLNSRHQNSMPPREISLLAGYGSEYFNGHFPHFINHQPFLNFETILQHKMPYEMLVKDNLEIRTGHLTLGAQGRGSNEELSLSLNGEQTHGEARRKRSWTRAVFSNLQRKGLEKRFAIQKYITKPDRRQLAATLGLTDAQVKVWFQNRRMKWRHSEMKKVKYQDQEGTQLCNIKSNRKRTNQLNSIQILQETNQQVTSSQPLDGEPNQIDHNYLLDSEGSDLDT